MSTENLEQSPSGEKPKGDIDHGKENPDRGQSTANVTCDKEKEKEKRKTAKPVQEPFEAWEREEMEKLLEELRGHLGERFPTLNRFPPDNLTYSCIPDAILGRRGHREQFPLQRRQTHAITNL
jgi:hypothetical protein